MQRFTDFQQGLVKQTSDFIVTDQKKLSGLRAFSLADDIVADETGIFNPPGHAKFDPVALPATIQGIHVHYNVLTGVNRLLVAANGNIYHYTGGVFVSLITGLSTTAKTRFCTFNGFTIILNGVDPVKQYNGTTVVDTVFTNPGVPEFPADARPTWAEVFKNNIFYTGAPLYPTRIFKPAAGTHTDFLSTNAETFDVNVGDGQPVVACVALTLGAMAIFKTGSIHLMSGSNPFDSTIDPLRVESWSSEVGCVAADTLVRLGDSIYFLSKDGYRQLAYVKANGRLIDAAESMYYLRPIFNGMDFTNITRANAAYNKQERLIYLSIPVLSPTGTNQVYTYNVVTQGVFRRTQPDIRHQYYDVNSNIHYMAKLGSNFLLRNNTGQTYDGVAITGRCAFLWWDGGAPNLRKRYKNFSILFSRISTIGAKIGLQYLLPDTTVGYQVQQQSGQVGTGWDVGTWGGTAVWDEAIGLNYRRLYCGRGNALKIALELSAPFKIDLIGFEAIAQGSNQR